MGSLGNIRREKFSLHKLLKLFCEISPSSMAADDQEVPLAEQLKVAVECLDKITESLETEGVTMSSVEFLASFSTSLGLVESCAQNPFWNREEIKVLEAVYDSIGRNRTMAQLLMADAARTPLGSPSCSPELSTSFDASGASVASQGDSQSQGEAVRDHISALRRHVTPDMRLASVAGMAQAKQLLTEAVIMPIRYRHLFTGARKPWHSVLLYGPPGTGKTKLALALAAEVDSELYAITPADLLSSWFGRTEQNIRDLFGQLRARGATRRVIVFLDEVDGLCRRRTNEEPESTRRMKTELLTQLQGDAAPSSGHAGHLFFVCATNCPWEIDPAFLRRFQRRVFIGLPDRDSRKEIIRTLAAGGTTGTAPGSELNLPAAEWQNLLDRTAGFSGSDLSDLVRNALYQPVRELTTATHWIGVAGGMWSPCSSNTVGAVRRFLHLIPAESVCARSVTIRDFYDVIESARPTVCEADLRRYEEFTQQFGQLG
ncbi:vacuolar protein sorting-associated protein 4-like isoform X2 [Thrips palmi]|uniref:Vacuolar protein sorting-associated protein 4-like isoform X2 n=1 Tax=Thrips palmi TaxID=161013 RepID=A0A6P8ZRK2_THRPL|nr:vacuolar protein sorting-associated protein 4-like isoform X2 [Thrips palmi]